ncbi:MAG TPA: hypothetical protein VFX45_06860 [Solirubrobacterales bacterium]|nr:hypothetical protein [Solirubrobacterales bacterium]
MPPRAIRRIALLPLLAAILGSGLALGSCGTSVQLSDEDVFDSLRKDFALPAYRLSYQRCVVGKIEQLASPSQIRDLAEGSEDEELEAALAVMTPAERACKRVDPRIIDPEAATGELAPIRLSTGSAVEREMKEEGLTDAEAACAKRRIRALDDAEFIRFANAPTDSQVDQIVEILLPCVR